MLDAADYLWWPKIHTMIIEKAEACSHCQATGKNLKSLIPKQRFEKQEDPTAANEEVQLDFAGPFFSNSNAKSYLLVAIDSFSKEVYSNHFG